MKSILFASTALVAFAGAAAAQGVALSGSAEMGIINADAGASDNPTGGDTEFHTDIDVTFTMSGETDNGLTFGATVDLDESNDNDAFNSRTQGGETIFISGNFGTLTMGDTDGAFDWAMTEVNFNSGSINDDETTHAGFSGNSGLDGTYDGQIARYDYAIGGLGFAISAELDDTDSAANDEVLGLGFTYGIDLGGTTVNLGLGYQTTQVANVDRDIVGVSANASFGSITAGINYSQLEIGAAEVDHVAVGLGYSSGPLSLNINYGDYDRGAAALDSDGFGLSAGYDLGGGAAIQFGYGTGEVGNAGSNSSYSLGVSMSF
ncbi:porin [Jannaschia sp. 2305UL9-9]|uniref:porin n=1 Tax=Jannaschia sp. 2305UL9-9 TaxID=3121638 RepID=UPI003528E37E